MRTTLDEFAFEAMNAMADDWESLDQIAPEVERFLGSADRSCVANLLVDLVAEGLCKVMQEREGQCLTAAMILETPIEFWFAMTPAGRALWNTESHKFKDDTVA